MTAVHTSGHSQQLVQCTEFDEHGLHMTDQCPESTTVETYPWEDDGQGGEYRLCVQKYPHLGDDAPSYQQRWARHPQLDLSGFEHRDGTFSSLYIMLGGTSSPIGMFNSADARKFASYLLAAADKYDALRTVERTE